MYIVGRAFLTSAAYIQVHYRLDFHGSKQYEQPLEEPMTKVVTSRHSLSEPRADSQPLAHIFVILKSIFDGPFHI